MVQTDKTYYDVLELAHGCSPDMIKQAYRTLSKRFHPDHNQEPGAAEQYLKVQEAYEVLSDAQKRWEYDQTLEVQSSQPGRRNEGLQQNRELAPETQRTSYYEPADSTTVLVARKIGVVLLWLLYAPIWLITHLFDLIMLIIGLSIQLIIIFIVLCVVISLFSIWQQSH